MLDIEAMGIGGVFEFGGKQLTLTALTGEDLALARLEVRKRSEDPLEKAVVACKELPEEIGKVLIAKAYDAYLQWGNLNSFDGKMWANSIEGLEFWLYRQTRLYHPEIQREWIQEKLKELSKARHEELDNVRNQIMKASGFIANPPQGTATSTTKKKRKKR